jgi:hypothetical protein
MPVAQSPAHYINSSKGCPSITESFPLVFFLVLCATVAALPVVQPHWSDTVEEPTFCNLGVGSSSLSNKCANVLLFNELHTHLQSRDVIYPMKIVFFQ